MTDRQAAGFAELFGIGGAGKTTLLGRLAERADAAPVRIGRPPHPGGVSVAGRSVRLATQVSLREPARTTRLLLAPGGRWLLSKLGYRLATFASRDPQVPIILADAGFLEPLVTHAMFFGAESEPPMSALLERLPAAAVAVSVRCDVEVAVERFLRRENDRRQWAGPDRATLSSWFRRAESRVGWLERWCETEGRMLIRIDTTTAPEDDVVDRLLGDITQYLEGTDA